MQITNVATTHHDADRVSIFVDGEFAFACHVTVWLASGLHVDAAISPADLAHLREAEDVRALRERALDLLAGRPRSRTDLQRRLARGTKTHPTPPPAQVAQVLDQLVEAGLIDDRAFAEFWVEQRDRFRPKGSLALRAELAQQGVRRDEASEAIAPDRDLERALAAARTRALRLVARPGMEARAFRDALGPFLTRRGFPYPITRAAILQLWGEFGQDVTALEEDLPDEG
ncbi:MAG: regulatory protein RecX [Ktedonobacterales bacterium]|nr:regulatory protein RecX [Ktedonobacterales bacterium]